MPKKTKQPVFQKKSYREIFSDPIMRIVLGLIVFVLLIGALDYLWLSHQWSWRSDMMHVTSVDIISTKAIITHTGGQFAAPADMAENITADSDVLITYWLSGTHKVKIISMEVFP